VPPAYPPPGYTPAFYPMTLGRGVSLSLHMYRFAWRTLVAISLITTVPMALITAAASALTSVSIETWQRSVTFNPLGGPPSPSEMLSTFPWPSIGLILLAQVVIGPIAVVGGAALIVAIATTISGGRPQVRLSFSATLARLRDLAIVYFVLIGTGLALGLAAALFPLLTALGPGGLGLSGIALFASLIAIVALVFAAAFIIIRLVFTIQTLMLEDAPVRLAIRRSWDLAAGSMLRIVGWVLVLSLIIGLIGILFEIVAFIAAFVVSPPQLSTLTTASLFSPVSYFVLTFLITAFSALVSPILSIGLTLLYFDIRHRHGENVPFPGRQPTS